MKKAKCPPEFALCGTLTVESGLGPGLYGGGTPGIHGLWPETGNYGNSKCMAPKDKTFDVNSSNVNLLCDSINETDNQGNFSFAKHEWTKHGMCSGGPGPASHYFNTMCNIGSPIVNLIKEKSSFEDMQSSIANSDYQKYLFNIDHTNKQFEFGVCSTGDGVWQYCTI
jgi:hypothetical protein